MTKLGARLGQGVSALSPYTILDLSEGGHNLCGRLLGDLGAHVIRVEPIGGSPTRLRGPFVKVGSSLLKEAYIGPHTTAIRLELHWILNRNGGGSFFLI